MADKTYDPKEIVFEKGDQSEFAYLIKSGEIEILKDYPEKPFRLAVLGAGNILGEMGLVDERPRSLTARAVSETRVSKISRAEFIDLILTNPEEAFKYLRMFFERLREMNTRVALGEPTASKTPTANGPTDWAVSIHTDSKIMAGIIGASDLTISKFPFRVGRRSNANENPLEVNDLSIPDKQPYNVSRNHFSIEKRIDGVFINDRGSYLGTIVNGNVVGGKHEAASIRLRERENQIIVGSSHSLYRFNLIVTSQS